MKLGDSRRKESPLDYYTERKERDNLFQVIERRKSQVGSPSKTAEVSRKMFNVLLAIGKGGFGKVWKVEGKRGGGVFAMKEMSKAKIIGKKSVTSVMNEKIFLSRLTHPFLVNMNCSFQDREHLYLIMDYLDGGDLRYHIGNRRCFNERETKFFIANILIGLQFLHNHKVIHRDIKP
jgi:serine/threonine protein kinase